MTIRQHSNKNAPSALIIGCGDVGNRLAIRLLNKGYKVWGLRRNTEHLARGVLPIQGDLQSEASLGKWPQTQIDYVVYCAAATEHSEAGYRQAYLHGMQHVLNRLQTADYAVKRLIFTSSTGVYHQSAGEWVNENSETLPQHMTGKIMLQTEQLALNATFPATVVRFGGIYGPGRNYLIHRVKQGEGYPNSPVVYGNRIHADDCAGIVEHLIVSDLAGKVVDTCYVGVDHCPAPLCEVTDWLASQLNVKISRVIDARGRGSKRCANRRIIESGYCFLFSDYKAGYATLLGSQ